MRRLHQLPLATAHVQKQEQEAAAASEQAPVQPPEQPQQQAPEQHHNFHPASSSFGAKARARAVQMEAAWDVLLQQLAAKLMPQLLEQQHAAPKYFHSRWALGTVLRPAAWQGLQGAQAAAGAPSGVLRAGQLHLPCCSLASLYSPAVLL